MTAARDHLAAILAEHILFGYGRCGCGAEFTRFGKYSADHRAHVADALLAAGVRTAEQVAQSNNESYEDGYDQGHADAHADGAAEDRVCRERKRAERAEAELAEARATITAAWEKGWRAGRGDSIEADDGWTKTPNPYRVALARPEGGSDAE